MDSLCFRVNVPLGMDITMVVLAGEFAVNHFHRHNLDQPVPLCEVRGPVVSVSRKSVASVQPPCLRQHRHWPVHLTRSLKSLWPAWPLSTPTQSGDAGNGIQLPDLRSPTGLLSLVRQPRRSSRESTG